MNFPTEFKKHLAIPNIKGAFISDIKPVHPRDCKNCGGIGTMNLFIATGGPFIDVPFGVVHFADGRWWTGKYFEEICPDCKGLGIDPNFVQPPVSMRLVKMPDLGIPTKIKKELDDYTDV